MNASAVARLVSAHLGDHPLDDQWNDTTDPTRLHDTISRALKGEGVSSRVLQLLMDTFDMEDEHVERLWHIWWDAGQCRAIYGSLAGYDGPRPPRTYETAQLYEFHYLGPGGIPKRHRTVEVIRALEDGVTTHRYEFDKREVVVERIHGGFPGNPYPLDNGLWAVDVQLPQVLRAGEAIPLEYETQFRQPARPAAFFRRAVHGRIPDVTVRVEFHTDMMPASVRWVEWEDYRPPCDRILRDEPVVPDSEQAVYRSFDVVESAVIGFAWQFAPAVSVVSL